MLPFSRSNKSWSIGKMWGQIGIFREPLPLSWFCIPVAVNLNDPTIRYIFKIPSSLFWPPQICYRCAESLTHPEGLLSPSAEPRSVPGLSQVLKSVSSWKKAEKQQCFCLSDPTVSKVAPPLPVTSTVWHSEGESGEPKQMSSLCGCLSGLVCFGRWLQCHLNSCPARCEALSGGPLCWILMWFQFSYTI